VKLKGFVLFSGVSKVLSTGERRMYPNFHRGDDRKLSSKTSAIYRSQPIQAVSTWKIDFDSYPLAQRIAPPQITIDRPNTGIQGCQARDQTGFPQSTRRMNLRWVSQSE
jgi:hypothetical protein